MFDYFPLINSIAFALISFATGYLWNKGRNMTRNFMQREDALNILLRDRIITIHSECMARGFITYIQLENVSAMYRIYHARGGNGMGTSMFEDLRGLPLKNNEKAAEPALEEALHREDAERVPVD